MKNYNSKSLPVTPTIKANANIEMATVGLKYSKINNIIVSISINIAQLRRNLSLDL